jgi:hypothetical protein
MKITISIYLVTVALAISATFTSCDKNDDDIGNNNVLLPKTITNNISRHSYSRNEYEYDKQNRITKILRYSNHEYFLKEAELDQIQTFTYVGDDFVKVVEERSGFTTVEFSKNGDKINVTRKYSSGEVYYTATMDLNNEGYPTKRESSFTFGTDNYQIDTYQFQNGNLMKQSIVRGNGPSSNLEFTYDNKKSPFFHCETPNWVMINLWEYGISKNNVIKVNGTSQYEYEYNIAEFPIKRTMNYTDGEEYITEYKYK